MQTQLKNTVGCKTCSKLINMSTHNFEDIPSLVLVFLVYTDKHYKIMNRNFAFSILLFLLESKIKIKALYDTYKSNLQKKETIENSEFLKQKFTVAFLKFCSLCNLEFFLKQNFQVDFFLKNFRMVAWSKPPLPQWPGDFSFCHVLPALIWTVKVKHFKAIIEFLLIKSFLVSMSNTIRCLSSK